MVIFSDQIHDLVFGSDQIDTPSSHSDWTTKEGFEASGIESLNDHLNHYLVRKI